MAKITEKIIIGLMKHDEDAFQIFFDEYKDILHYVVMGYVNNRETALDLEQEIFLRVFSKIHTYNPEISTFSTWFITLAKNYVISYLRKEKNNAILDNDIVEKKTIESNVMFDLIVDNLKDYMDDDEYTILIMKVFNVMSFKEISEYLEIDYKLCRKKYENAVRKAREILYKE